MTQVARSDVPTKVLFLGHLLEIALGCASESDEMENAHAGITLLEKEILSGTVRDKI